MAWAPSTNFEDDLVELQPDFNFIHGQLAYEANHRTKQDFTPRPKSTYEYIRKREIRNEEIKQENCSKTKEIAASLAMMEQIQQIAGTKRLGEHATMADLEDESTVEREAVAMMRHFGMMSMADGALLPPKEETVVKCKVKIVRNGRKSFPLIMDPSYFEPGGTRKKSAPNSESGASRTGGSSNSFNNYKKAETGSTVSSYFTARTHSDDSFSSKESYEEIQYNLLQTSGEEATLRPPCTPSAVVNNGNKSRRRSKKNLLEREQ